MASVWRHPKSRYWSACFTNADGVQLKRSTKLTDRAKAQRMAERFEAAYRSKLTEAQARKVISDIFQELHGEELHHSTARKFLTEWLAGKKAEMSPGSYKRYENAVTKLLTFLGERAERDIAYVHKRDLTELRDKTATALSPSTANTDLKILRVAFRQAVADGLRLDNPAAAVSELEDRKEAGAAERRPFTEEELRALLKVATGEWQGLILGGLYTGQRLGDLASMTTSKIDLNQALWTFRSQKTGRDMVIPLAAPFLDYLKKNAPAERNQPVFPLAFAQRKESDGESRRLSAQFHALLVQAGLAEKRSKRNTGRGHSVRRAVSELTFHSLRHNTTSWLKRAGVSEAVVRDIIGHESDVVSRSYTHIDEATKLRAIQQLPELK